MIHPLRVHAQRVLLVGAAAEELHAELAETVPLIDCKTIPQAVRKGFEGAMSGDSVLLSPGCASFDMFRDYEARGAAFKSAVAGLAGSTEEVR